MRVIEELVSSLLDERILTKERREEKRETGDEGGENL